MKIEKTLKHFGSHKTGELQNMSVAKITKKLGLAPEIIDEDDSDGKVKYEWRFLVDGIECCIWDYKGSSDWNQFSTFGPNIVFETIFKSKYVSERE